MPIGKPCKNSMATALAAIKPELVQKAAPNCQKLFDAVLARLA